MKKTKADWLAAVDDVERRMITVRGPLGARPSRRVNMDRSTFRVALIEAFTAGKLSMVNAAPRARKRRAS